MLLRVSEALPLVDTSRPISSSVHSAESSSRATSLLLTTPPNPGPDTTHSPEQERCPACRGHSRDLLASLPFFRPRRHLRKTYLSDTLPQPYTNARRAAAAAGRAANRYGNRGALDPEVRIISCYDGRCRHGND